MPIRIYGNRSIKTLPGQTTRPTPARVREALFNIWQGRIVDARWLDLCAGSGAMGAEALCRGASSAVGIEQSSAACRIIRQNWQTVAQPEQSFVILKGDVVAQLKRLQGQQFNLAYFDPPYASGLYQPALEALVALLSPTAEVAIEHDPALWQATAPKGLAIVRQKRYGSTHLVFMAPEQG
ncbi:MAG: 16S rRNA (guanine(966)-N(2))-methyltransferase RsmD [Leptolyngbya sp. SIO4C1]|nr:16S rRNA (guanine(966)-N(2))-methyltransferase RsmD [Leptolyngbya sp. SIO4C1]